MLLDRALAGLVVLAAAGAFFHDAAGSPPGYPVDMVSVALNAHCVSETGTDEYGAAWPLVGFRSFEDYKGVANLYGLAALYAVFGPSLLAARLLSMGLTFAATLALVSSLRYLPAPPHRPPLTAHALIFALLLLSPWLILPKRVMVEDGVLYALGAAAVLAAGALLRRPRSVGGGLACGLASGLLAHAYSPGKVLFVAVPLLLLLVLWFEAPARGAKLVPCRGVWLAWVTAGVVALPHLFDVLGPARGLSRFRTVGGHFDIGRVAQGLANNLDPRFLFFSGDPEPHRHMAHGGMLNVVFLPLAVVGLLVVVARARREAFARFSLGLFPATFLPAALAAQAPPHGGRALLAVIPIAIASGYALNAGWSAAATIPRRRAAIAAFAVWTAVGIAVAVADLRHFFGPYSERNLWAYTRPKPRWRLVDGRVDPGDHSPETAPERFFRAAHLGQEEYCGGGDP